MAPALRHRMSKHFRKLFSLEGLPEPQKSAQSSPVERAPQTSQRAQNTASAAPGLASGSPPHSQATNGQQQVPLTLTSAAPAQNLPTVLGSDCETNDAVRLSLEERFQGLYVIGANGTGKTTVILNMVISDLLNNRGLCLIEPHGDLTRNVIAAMPEERLKDVIYLDLTDPRSSFGLNFFECPTGADDTDAAKIASFVMHLFETIWNVGFETPRLATVLRNTTRVLMENPGMTFSEIPLLLWEDGVREKLVRRVTNTQTKLFWSAYNHKQLREREELIASTINKVDAYLNEPLIARIVSQSTSTIDFRRIMDEGKILLVHLSPQLEEPSRLIGAAILGRLLMASFSRADTPKEQRRPFMIYADEYQRFATQDFAVFLAEARKAKVATTIANQVLEQLSDLNRATALQAGTLVVMRVSGEDSKVLAPSFDATPQPALVGEEPIRATPADPLGHLVRHGSNHPTVAKFLAEYLMPLASLVRQASSATHLFQLGCATVTASQISEGHRQLNEAFATCMREKRSNVQLSPWALFCLAGAAAPAATYAFYKDLRHEWEYVPIVGFDRAAKRYGSPSFLTSAARREDDLAFLRKGVKASIFESKATRAARVAAFTRMHKAIRETMEILVKDPILVDTGQYQPKYQLRTYQDQENLVANCLSQLPNYTAKVKLLSGEHTIKTNPPPQLLAESEVDARIQTIKERMLSQGYTTPAQVVDENVAKRHEQLRQRPPEVFPPIHTSGRRTTRGKQPPQP